jgi:small ligand-binding sensory domain FIST
MSMQDQHVTESFPFAHAAARHWRIAAAECLEQLGAIPASTNLGFLYVTDRYADKLAEVLELMKARTGVEHWVGTVGLGICATGQEYLDEGALAVMLGSFEPGAFRVLSSLRTPADLARDPLTIGGAPGNFAIVHADPRNSTLTALVAELSRRLESGYVVGGLASSRGAHGQIADGVVEGGLSGVVFAESVVVSTRLTQGCSPIGPVHHVTDCRQNVLIELDERPALDVLRDDVGPTLGREAGRAGGGIFAALPVSDGAGSDYTVRDVVGIDAERGLVAIGETVRRGARIMFCRRDRRSAVEDMARMLESMKSGLYTRPRGAVYFSCLGRGVSLFGEMSRELEMIREGLGDFPLVGCYCNGEISHNRLYGYTGVLTLFL